MTAARRVLDRALDGVEGWLDPAEAWALHEAARNASTRGPATVVEIGSYHGRSTIALGLGLRHAGGGRLIAVDPFDMEEGQFDIFRSNLERAGVWTIVEPIRARSRDARPRVPDGVVSVLFVDGSHEYDDVVADVELYRTTLAEGAVAAFNDPYWDGVSRALRDTLARADSPFRRPRWILNTLLVDFDPTGSPTMIDLLDRIRLRAFLALGRRWLRMHWRVVFSTRVPDVAKHLQLRLALIVFRLILPVERDRS